MELKDGKVYIIHVHSVGWIGFDIRLLERIRYGRWAWANHSAILLQDKGVWYVYEAEKSVVRTLWVNWKLVSENYRKKFILTEVPPHYFTKPDYSTQPITDFANKLLGEGYDYFDLIVEQPIDMIIGIDLPYISKTKTICSRLVAHIIMAFTKDIFVEENISPALIFKICSTLK